MDPTGLRSQQSVATTLVLRMLKTSRVQVMGCLGREQRGDMVLA
jgi:hypothetical protein